MYNMIPGQNQHELYQVIQLYWVRGKKALTFRTELWHMDTDFLDMLGTQMVKLG